MNTKLTVTAIGVFAAASALAISAFAANAAQGDTRPGWGYGDQNHVHTGPPGQSVHPQPNGS